MSAISFPNPEVPGVIATGLNVAATDRSILFSSYNWTVHSREKTLQSNATRRYSRR